VRGRGVRVIVTRAPEQAEPLATRLRELGHEVVFCPLIQIEPLGDETVDCSGYDWVVVTSVNGAVELARRRTGELSRVAAIGPGTADALRERGIEPALVAQVSTQEGLLAELPRLPGRVLLAAAEDARRLIVEELGADFLPLYRVVELVPDSSPDGDVIALASPSAARAFGKLDLPIPAVSIGPQTTAAARAAGLEVVAEAKEHDLEGLLAAVARVPKSCSSPS
jgi:uroporphyrinogen III methyltransferase / synthase